MEDADTNAKSHCQRALNLAVILAWRCSCHTGTATFDHSITCVVIGSAEIAFDRTTMDVGRPLAGKARLACIEAVASVRTVPGGFAECSKALGRCLRSWNERHALLCAYSVLMWGSLKKVATGRRSDWVKPELLLDSWLEPRLSFVLQWRAAVSMFCEPRPPTNVNQNASTHARVARSCLSCTYRHFFQRCERLCAAWL